MPTPFWQAGLPLPEVTEQDLLLQKAGLGALLRLRFALAASQGAFFDAVSAHADLQALRLVDAADPSMTLFNKILLEIREQPVLGANIHLGTSGQGNHTLLRQRFTITEADPEDLQDIRLICAGNQRKLDYFPSVDWIVPQNWEKCRLVFKGTAGASFKVVEFREPSTAAD
jgi:hypothetical protein